MAKNFIDSKQIISEFNKMINEIDKTIIEIGKMEKFQSLKDENFYKLIVERCYLPSCDDETKKYLHFRVYQVFMEYEILEFDGYTIHLVLAYVLKQLCVDNEWASDCLYHLRIKMGRFDQMQYLRIFIKYPLFLKNFSKLFPKKMKLCDNVQTLLEQCLVFNNFDSFKELVLEFACTPSITPIMLNWWKKTTKDVIFAVLNDEQLSDVLKDQLPEVAKYLVDILDISYKKLDVVKKYYDQKN